MQLLALLVLSLVPDEPAKKAQADEPGLWDREHLLGDLGGARAALEGRGVTWVLNATAETHSNVHGGLDTGTKAEMLADGVVDADLAKLAGWNGGSARVNPMWIEGHGVSRDRTGDLMKVSNIDARDGFRLFEAWVQQSAFDGRCSVRAGILAADQEFLLSDHSGLFLSGTFGMPVLVSANVPAPVYPVGAPGVRIAAEPVDGLTARFAVYDGQPGAEHFNETGLRLRFQDEEGLLAVGELEWRRASGCVKAGFFRHSARFFDHSGNESRNGHHGLYVAADQELAEGLGAFIRLGGTPDDRSLIGFYLDAGVVWTGFLPGRDEDALGLAAAWAELSGDFADAQADPSDWDREILIELTWRIALAKWFHVLPDYQLLLHPGGTSATDDAHVVGLRVDLYF